MNVPEPTTVLFPTCIVDAVTPQTGMSTAAILASIGEVVEVPDEATCCGQPAWNAGHAGAAAMVARTTLEALADTEGPIVVPSGSCTTMIRVFWPELFELHGDAGDRAEVDDVASRTFELSEYLASRGAPDTAIEGPPIVYHRSCHMLRELGIVEEPERILDGLGVDRRVSAAEGRCCGFGGLFSVKLPEASTAMADEVLDAAAEAGAEEIVGCDASCLMHLRARAESRQLSLGFSHFADVVVAAVPEPS